MFGVEGLGCLRILRGSGFMGRSLVLSGLRKLAILAGPLSLPPHEARTTLFKSDSEDTSTSRS